MVSILIIRRAFSRRSLVLSKAKGVSNKFIIRLIVLNILLYSLLPKDYQRELKERAIPKFNKITDEFPFSKKINFLKLINPTKEYVKRNIDVAVETETTNQGKKHYMLVDVSFLEGCWSFSRAIAFRLLRRSLCYPSKTYKPLYRLVVNKSVIEGVRNRITLYCLQDGA